MTDRTDGAHARPDQSVGTTNDENGARLERRAKERKERRRAVFIAVLLLALLGGVVVLSTDRVLHKKPTTGAITPIRAG